MNLHSTPPRSITRRKDNLYNSSLPPTAARQTCEYIPQNPIRYYEPHTFSTLLTPHVFTGSEHTTWQTPPMWRKRQQTLCYTHPCGGYYTTKKTTQGTIAHQAKIYAPHNLEINYYKTIVLAILHNHKDKNTGNNSLPKQRTTHCTILN